MSEEVVIENVPFRYAVPVLNGWELAYSVRSHEIRKIGVWLEDSDYVWDEETGLGRLSYTVNAVIRDEDDHRNAEKRMPARVRAQPL